MKTHQKWYDIAFLAPGTLVFLLFMVVPVLVSLSFSFTNWNGISAHYRWIGVGNFVRLLGDDAFHRSLAVTGAITLLTTVAVNVVGILAAVVIDRPGRLFTIGKTLIFIPAILSPVVVSFVWAYMTQTNGGIINTLLALSGLPEVDLYRGTGTVTVMVSGVIAWAALGFYTTVYIANLKAIPLDLYEAAAIDGAAPMRRFVSITLPMLRPAITINTITAVIWGLKQYDFVRIMVPGYIRTVAIYAIERAMDFNMFGYSSAIVFVLLLVTLLIASVQMGVLRRRYGTEY